MARPGGASDIERKSEPRQWRLGGRIRTAVSLVVILIVLVAAVSFFSGLTGIEIPFLTDAAFTVRNWAGL